MPGNTSILITGAAGFVGRRVMALLAGQENVLASDFLPDEGSRIEGCDISDNAAVRKLFESYHPQTVIHLAALLPTASNLDPERATRINIGGGLNLLQAAVETGVKRFVFSSSSSVYGYSHREPPRPKTIHWRRKTSMEPPRPTWSSPAAACRRCTVWSSPPCGSRPSSGLECAIQVPPGAPKFLRNLAQEFHRKSASLPIQTIVLRWCMSKMWPECWPCWLRTNTSPTASITLRWKPRGLPN